MTQRTKELLQDLFGLAFIALVILSVAWYFSGCTTSENTVRITHKAIVSLSIAPMSSNAGLPKEMYSGEVRINGGEWFSIGIPSEPKWEGQSGEKVVFEFRTIWNELPLRFNVQSYTSGRIKEGKTAIPLDSERNVTNPAYERFEVIAE